MPTASKRFPRQLAAAVILLNGLVIVIASLSLTQSLQQYRNRATVAANNISRVLAENIADTVDRIDLGLLATADEFERQLDRGRVDGTEINATIARQYARQPDLDSLRIADERGSILYGIGVKPGSHINMADREFFIRARDDARAQLIISKPVVGRISGKWAIALVRRLNRPDGSFAGVVYAVIALARFERMFAALDLGPGGVVSFRGLDLGLIARQPEPTGPGGEIGNRTVSETFREILRTHPDAGNYSAPTGLDHIDRTISYRRVSNYPAYIIVGLATGDYLAAWHQEVNKILLLVSLFVLSTFATAWLLYRAWRLQADAVSVLARQEEKFRTLIESSPDALVIADAAGIISIVNQQTAEMFGYEPDELIGRPIEMLLPERYRGAHVAMRLRYAGAPMLREMGKDRDLWGLAKDGREFPTSISLSPIATEQGPMVAAAIRDASLRRRTEEEQALMARVFSNSSEAIIITDADNRIIACNPAFTALTGYEPEEALGKNPSFLSSGNNPREIYEQMWSAINEHGAWRGELWDRRKSGEPFPKWLSISVVRDKSGRILNYIGSFVDISERKASEEKIRHLAHYDALTDLPNRFSLHERLEQAIGYCRRSGKQLALLLIDLDRFKLINDSFGHNTGDQLLIQVAKRLTAAVRDSDIVARLGGDEFVVVLPEIEAISDAAHVAGKIVAAVSLPYLIDDHDQRTSPSIGISLYPDDAIEISDLIKSADVAMYHAKAFGRGNFQFFTEEMNIAAVRRMDIESDLRVALEHQQFVLQYQPQVDLDSRRLVGFEALVRWRHPAKGLIAPDEFIPIAEDTGLIVPLGEWILRQACRQLKAWHDQGAVGLRMSVNLSAVQFHDKDLLKLVKATLAETGLAPARLDLEVTESMAMRSPTDSIVTMQALRDIGVTLTIDDFGTGYSSLAYLKLFPIQALKIDRSFVKDIERDGNDAAICAATIALAHKLNLSVIAEGVETEAQLEFLNLAGCETIQGYLFSRPLYAADAWTFIAARASTPPPDD